MRHWICGILFVMGITATVARGEDYDSAPIFYSTGTPDNPVSRLADAIEAGTVTLPSDGEQGYLRELLKALDIPESSQLLVFSKTSLQRQRITARTPRALYFNDDVYVGYCQNGEMLEISTADAKLGTVYYTLSQEPAAKPILKREHENCLLCHSSHQTKGVPGHLVRSVYADASGLPDLSAGTHRINQNSPIKDRWGGWYVTGTHGAQKHLGNLIVRGRTQPEDVDNSAGMNVTDISDRFRTGAYLTPHSDLVALMVLEHQTDAHNLLAKASFETRQALHYEASLNRDLKKPEGEKWESTGRRVRSVGDALVEYMLYSNEAPLTAPLAGTSGFAEEFAARGPRDSKGRSLRDFDLTRRMFKYPCSYLVYSESFQSLPPEVKEHVWQRMHDVLTGKDQSEPFVHLSQEDRQAILEILLETVPDLPGYWREAPKPEEPNL